MRAGGVLPYLGDHPRLGNGTMCITNLRGGEKYLLVPGEAGFTISAIPC